MPIIKKLKVYAYEFDTSLEAIIEELNKQNIFPLTGQKDNTSIKLTFVEELTTATFNAVNVTLQKLVPNLKYKRKIGEEVELG